LRYRQTNLAIFVYLARANYIIYFFSSIEGLETGTFIYFISYGLTPLAFYGYSDRWKGIGYALVSFSLFLVSKFDWKNFKPDHAHFYFIINYTVVLFTIGFIILFFDRMNKEAVMKINKQNKALEKANEELDRFVYSASHDFRSPLASILGLVNIYEMAASNDEKVSIIKMIAERTLKLDGFITKILDYSRNAREEIKTEPIELRKIVFDTLDTVKYNPGYNTIQFQVDMHADQIIVSDLERLKIILLNLLSNAIKYRNTKRENSFVKISSDTSTGYINLTIQDNGIGIDQAHLPKIFDMFYRAHANSDGSGIGLYIVKECVEKIGGRIRVQSESSIGTTFTVSIPHRPLL
jgi:signal transduction histidine kinase